METPSQFLDFIDKDTIVIVIPRLSTNRYNKNNMYLDIQSIGITVTISVQ